MEVASIVLIILLAIDGIIHVFSLAYQKYPLRVVTKALILPCILSIYIIETKSLNVLLIIAFCLGWLGDLVLLEKGKKYFPVGGVLFGAEQILLLVIILMRIDYAKTPLVWLIILPIIYVTIMCFFMKTIKPYVKLPLFLASSSYMITNGLVNAFALCLLISNPCLNNILFFIGATFFIVSDTLLIYVKLNPHSKFHNKEITIMITYIIAQLFVMFGNIFK